MKYKVIVNASLPEIRLALSIGQELDDELDSRLTKNIIKTLQKNKWIETGKKETDERR